MLAKRIAAFLTLALMVLTAVELARVSHSRHQSQHREQGQPAPAKTHEAPSGPSVAEAANDKQGDEGKQKGSWQDKFLDHMPDWFVALFTGVLAGITWRLVTMTGRLWESTEKLWKAGERQIRIADQSAHAAQDAADTAKETLVASQRAWIKCTKVRFQGDLTIGAHGADAGILIDFLNVGNAPALHIKQFAWFLPMTDGKIPLDKARAELHRVKRMSPADGFLLFPNEGFPDDDGYSPPCPAAMLTRQQVDAASGGQGDPMRLYVAGCVNYSFPTDLRRYHQTAFFYEVEYEATGSGLVPAVDGRIPGVHLRLRNIGFGGTDRVD